MSTTFKARSIQINGDILDALPFLMTIIVLVIVSTQFAHRRLGAPASLGIPYEREER
jgi:simple sugar transport system permease protein